MLGGGELETEVQTTPHRVAAVLASAKLKQKRSLAAMICSPPAAFRVFIPVMSDFPRLN